jgi:hypothetical protein
MTPDSAPAARPRDAVTPSTRARCRCENENDGRRHAALDDFPSELRTKRARTVRAGASRTPAEIVEAAQRLRARDSRVTSMAATLIVSRAHTHVSTRAFLTPRPGRRELANPSRMRSSWWSCNGAAERETVEYARAVAKANPVLQSAHSLGAHVLTEPAVPRRRDKRTQYA